FGRRDLRLVAARFKRVTRFDPGSWLWYQLRRLVHQVLQDVAIQTSAFRQAFKHQLAKDAFWQPVEQWSRALAEARSAFHGADVQTFGHGIEQIVFQRYRHRDLMFKFFRAYLTDKRIRVFPFRQKEKLHHPTVFHGSERAFQCAEGGGAARFIAVKAEDDFAGIAKRTLQVFFAASGSQCGYTVANTKLRQTHHIHVALDHQEARQ